LKKFDKEVVKAEYREKAHAMATKVIPPLPLIQRPLSNFNRQ